MKRFLSAAGAAAVAAAISSAMPAAAAAGMTPLRGTVSGAVAVTPCGPATLCLSGHETGAVSHLGWTTVAKTATVHFTGPCPGGSGSTFSEEVVLTGSNGDALYLAGTGSGCAVEGNVRGSADLTITGGKGRFTDASGSVTETFDHDLADDGETSTLAGAVSSPGSAHSDLAVRNDRARAWGAYPGA